jgi:hypothetical protein
MRARRTKLYYSIFAIRSSTAFILGNSITRVTGNTLVARIFVIVGMFVLCCFATKLTSFFRHMLIGIGAVLNYMVFRASYATLLTSLIVVRVTRAHLAIALLVMVDGGHTLVGQELTNRTTKATVLSFVRLVLPLNTNHAFGGTHFI